MPNYFRPGTYALVPNKHLLPQMKGAPLSVYVVLCSHMNDQGICFPGVARIMDLTGYSRPVVFRALKTLIDLGVIERHNRFGDDSGQDSNLYRILIADYPQGGVADDTGGSRTRYGGGVADDTGPRVADDTLTNPSELTHLRNNNQAVEKSSSSRPDARPASTETIDRVRQQLAAKGIVRANHDLNILRHKQTDGHHLEPGNETGHAQKPAKPASKRARSGNAARHADSQLAIVQT